MPRRFGQTFGTEHIVPDSLPGVLPLHQGHVLVGGGMEDHRGTMARKNPIQPCHILHVANDKRTRYLRELPLKFLLDPIQGELRDVQQNQQTRIEQGELASQFRTD